MGNITGNNTKKLTKEMIFNLSNFSRNERVNFMEKIRERYCFNCGRDHYKKVKCQCWNDE